VEDVTESAAPDVVHAVKDVVPVYRPFDPQRAETTLLAALLRARRRRGGGFAVIEDADGRTLTYDEVVRAVYALGSALSRLARRRETVGVMMPTGAPGAIAVLALSAYGRIPAMLNFTAGARNLKAACALAGIRTIVTARAFIERAGLEMVASALAEQAMLVHLEDVREGLGLRNKAMALVGAYAPGLIRGARDPRETAVVLFTSGTEGAPKGVALSHRAIVANVEQVLAHVPELVDADVIFNPLPIFHSFGLTAGTMLPLLGGLKAALHPTPLTPKEIARRIQETGATILLGTDTFVSQYARAGEEGALSGLRFAVCGAERVRDETRALVRRKHGVLLLEGYGVTEAAPVLSVNLPTDNRPGTVGRLLPGIEYRLEPVEGIPGAGRLFVRGPNMMSGYLEPGGTVVPLPEGWHDTGDVVSVGADGYVRIRGRLRRFAKIGGEMVSLDVVENCAYSLWPDHMHAAAAVSHERKGEQIVLFTNCPDCNRADLVAFIQNHAVPELATPRKIFLVDSIPTLGTGKTDYAAVQRLAETDAAVADGGGGASS